MTDKQKKEILEELSKVRPPTSLSDEIGKIIDRKFSETKDIKLYKAAGLSSIDKHRWQNPQFRPGKEKLLSMLIALHLTSDEVTSFLARKGYPTDTPLDVIVRISLDNNIYDFFELNELIQNFNEKNKNTLPYLGGIEY